MSGSLLSLPAELLRVRLQMNVSSDDGLNGSFDFLQPPDGDTSASQVGTAPHLLPSSLQSEGRGQRVSEVWEGGRKQCHGASSRVARLRPSEDWITENQKLQGSPSPLNRQHACPATRRQINSISFMLIQTLNAHISTTNTKTNRQTHKEG